MFIITDKIKKTVEMEKYEKETGKNAIWRGFVTEGFHKWKNGEKIYNISKERISLYVTKDIKSKWLTFSKKNDYSNISKLIRDSVNNYIENKNYHIKENFSLQKNEDLSKFSYILKESLSFIKGSLQLILEDRYNELHYEVVKTISIILNQVEYLENNIIKPLDEISYDKNNYEILIIEDSITILSFIKKYFERKGYKCRGISSGSKGIEALKHCNPKLIILDIILPDLNGFEILRIIKQNEKTKDIPVFFITAISEAKVKDKIEISDAEGVIYKPFGLKQLQVLMKYL